jgi:hypothetical protein
VGARKVAFGLIFASLAFGQVIINPPGGSGGTPGPPGSGNNTACSSAGASTTTYTCPTPTPTVTTLTGLIVSFVPNNTNTGTSTLNVAGLGPVQLDQSNCSTPVGSGGLVAGTTYLFSYIGSVFCLSGNGANVASTASVLKGNSAGSAIASSITDNGTAVSTTEPFSATSIATGATPPALAWFGGTSGIFGLTNGTCTGTVPAGAEFICNVSGVLNTLDSTGTYPLGKFTAAGSGAVPQGVQAKERQLVSVEDFGAISDGSTNNDTPIADAIAALTEGQTLYFPCTVSAGVYVVHSPVNFGALNKMNIRGHGSGCYLDYEPQTGGSQPAAFTFVGAYTVDIDQMNFESTITSSVIYPKVILLLGRPTASPTSFAGKYNFRNCSFEGTASVAAIYSIASEEDHWENPSVYLNNGGGALYAWYTSGYDDLGVGGGLPSVAESNLDIWVDGFHFNDFSMTTTSHVLIVDASTSSSYGEHHYLNGYMSTGSAGTGITFRNKGTSGNTGHNRTEVDNVAQEGGFRVINFDGPSGTAVADIDIKDVHFNSATYGTYFAQSTAGVELYTSTMEQNYVGDGETNSLGAVVSSKIRESFATTVSTPSVNSCIENTVTGVNNCTGTLDINLLQASTLNAGLSNQFVVNSQGQIVTPNGSYGQGYMSNLLTYSQFDPGTLNFDPWFPYGYFSGTPCTYTANSTDYQDIWGTYTSLKFLTSSTCTGWLEYSLPVTSGLTYSASIRARGAVGGESLSIGIDDTHGQTHTLTTTPTWYCYTGQLSDGSRGWQVLTGTTGQTIYMSGAQLELGSTCGPYVRTTSTDIPSTYTTSAASVNPMPFISNFTGTSGTAQCSMGLNGVQKMVTCALNGYAQTGSAGTFAFLTPFAQVPLMTYGTGCTSFPPPSPSTTTLTLPSNASMTAESCEILVIGQ